MKKIFLLLSLTIILFSCQQSKDIKTFNKELIQIVKDNSLYSDSINWSSLEKEIDSISKNILSIEQCTITANYVIKRLRAVGDNHSFYLPKEKTKLVFKQNLNPDQPEVKYLGNKIAYIKVPGFMSGNDSICKIFATKIQLLIKSMDSITINGWIVDLRGNTGGNMYPMIAGLGPLIGEGILGYFIDRKGGRESWSYINGSGICKYLGKYNDKKKENITHHNKNKTIIHVENPYKVKNNNAKIAVLIGNQTASSGEMTAISFIGKSNVKLFGQATGGYTTGNVSFILSDSSGIALAASIVADRDMKIYRGKIIPDVIVDNYNSDCIEVAVKWLKEK